ncbi:MAG: CNNM domain-containing protein, partial [Thermodesulfobacteriota bacterium]
TIFGDAYVGVISGVLTLLILIISEILPKTLGALYWRELTPLVVKLLTVTLVTMYPLVKLSQILTAMLTRGKENILVDRDEITALTKLGVREGVIQENESEILGNLLRFQEIKVKDIMTPRTVIFSLDEQLSTGDVLKEHSDISFSRIPVYGNNQDDITGFILKADLFLEVARGRGDTKLFDLKRPIAAVSREMPLHKLFDTILNNRAHIALVFDQYGGTEGLVTQEDLIETLLGMEIVDEADRVDDMQKLARRQWKRRARQMGIKVESVEGTKEEKEDESQQQ